MNQDNRSTSVRINEQTKASLTTVRVAYARQGRLFRSFDEMLQTVCAETTARLKEQTPEPQETAQ